MLICLNSITLLINENEETIVLQPGDTSYTLGPVDKYSEISIVNITPSSSSVAKYSVNIINPNGNGKFDIKIIEVKNNVETIYYMNILNEERIFRTETGGRRTIC